MATGVSLNAKNINVGGTAWNRVTSATPHLGGSLIAFMGDDDRFPTVLANSENHPGVSITTANVGLVAPLSPVGYTPVTITFTYADAMRVTGGNINWTIINCVFRDWSQSQSHGSFNSATATWDCVSDDGQTSPISFTTS